MIRIITFAFIITLISDVTQAHQTPQPTCKSCELCRPEICPRDFVYDPVCGKREIKGRKREKKDGNKDQGVTWWEYRVFENQCEMDNANLCAGGYRPCCWFKEMMKPSKK
ncbi:unnamed protein product [Nezara viridula]|uniref:Neuropeptide n=1 Tax=Nezara viridula TaxID=85310 RepID=A0A9P0HRY8_NEZVI|nr:unnamed protein product [Nezara viridula]